MRYICKNVWSTGMIWVVRFMTVGLWKNGIFIVNYMLETKMKSEWLKREKV